MEAIKKKKTCTSYKWTCRLPSTDRCQTLRTKLSEAQMCFHPQSIEKTKVWFHSPELAIIKAVQFSTW